MKSGIITEWVSQYGYRVSLRVFHSFWWVIGNWVLCSLVVEILVSVFLMILSVHLSRYLRGWGDPVIEGGRGVFFFPEGVLGWFCRCRRDRVVVLFVPWLRFCRWGCFACLTCWVVYVGRWVRRRAVHLCHRVLTVVLSFGVWVVAGSFWEWWLILCVPSLLLRTVRSVQVGW